jgi:hypothetical protein
MKKYLGATFTRIVASPLLVIIEVEVMMVLPAIITVNL